MGFIPCVRTRCLEFVLGVRFKKKRFNKKSLGLEALVCVLSNDLWKRCMELHRVSDNWVMGQRVGFSCFFINHSKSLSSGAKRVSEPMNFFGVVGYLSETLRSRLNFLGSGAAPQFIDERSEFVIEGTWMCLKGWRSHGWRRVGEIGLGDLCWILHTVIFGYFPLILAVIHRVPGC